MAIIEMHSSWLAVNSIIGCPNGCKYCLLQADGNNLAKPRKLASPEVAIKELLKCKYYDEDIPVCLFPNTDIFVNQSNIDYLMETFDVLEKQKIKNDIIIITKLFIPDCVINKVKELKNKGINVVFYISYSGLGKDIEPNINEDVLKSNFKRLYENNIDVVHYFRPFLPQNSDSKKIKEILDYVNKYTNVSVTTGLALIKTFIDKIDFWEDIKDRKEECLKANCVWPASAWNYFNNNYNHNQQIFQTNTCALNTKLKKSSTQYYGSYECINYNHCSQEQKERCKLFHKNINKIKIKQKCFKLLEHLGYKTNDIEFIFDEYNGLEIKGLRLSIADLSYLSFKLCIKVYVSSNEIVDNTYNSPLNGAKPLIIEENKL